MKVTRIKDPGVKTDVRLKPYLLTSSLVALLKRVAEEVTRVIPQRAPAPVPVRVRR